MLRLILLSFLFLVPAYLPAAFSPVDQALLGFKNFAKNPGIENGKTFYTRYADAAAAPPVDGTGGSPSVLTTITASTSSPLAGSYSLILSKDAVNRQGEGFSTDFTVDSEMKSKVVNVRFTYEVSANFTGGSDSANGSVLVYLYDVTNAVLIQPAPYKLTGGSTGGPHMFDADFQTASDSTSYRLIWHIAETGTTAWTMKMDSLFVGRNARVRGPPVTDWTAYTPSLTTNNGVNAITLNASSKTDPFGFWRRVGDSVEIRAAFNNGSGGAASGTAGTFELSLPPGIVPDTAKITSNGQTGFVVGVAQNFILPTAAQYAPDHAVQAVLGVGIYRLSQWKQATNAFAALADIIANTSVNFHVKFPVAGWSSSVQMSQDTDTRAVAASATGNPASVVATAVIVFPTLILDTHGAYSVSTGRYTCPVAGIYRVSVSGSHFAAAQSWFVYKNGTIGTLLFTASASDTGFSGSVLVQCSAGDLLDFRSNQTTDVGDGSIQFMRLSGPATIAASEKIRAKAYGATTSIPNAATTTVVNPTKKFDTHGAYSTTTGLFTAPRSGFVSVSAAVNASSASGTGAINNAVLLQTNKNGSTDSFIGGFVAEQTGTGLTRRLSGSTVIQVIAGDTVGVQINNPDSTFTCVGTEVGAWVNFEME